jgi:hypothetical protein
MTYIELCRNGPGIGYGESDIYLTLSVSLKHQAWDAIFARADTTLGLCPNVPSCNQLNLPARDTHVREVARLRDCQRTVEKWKSLYLTFSEVVSSDSVGFNHPPHPRP